MRINQIELVRYGHFTNKRLEFPENRKAPGGIHIVYGPNEAGKSTALRALVCLISGFPHSCEDGFLHGQSNLLVAGELTNSHGDSLFFQRRKGTTNIFSDRNQQPLKPEKVISFLGEISQSDFRMRYGIDHVELKKGAEQLAQEITDVSLLSSLLGGLNISNLIKELEDSCDSLFKPRGQNQNINKLLKEYEENSRLIHQREFQATKYKELQKDRVAREKEREEIQHSTRNLEVEFNRLQRLSKALPLANQRETLQSKLHSLGEIRKLSPEFKDHRLVAQNNLTTHTGQLAELGLNRKGLEEQLASFKGISIDTDFDEQVQSLVKRLQSYRDAARDLPNVRQSAETNLALARLASTTIPGTPTLDQILAINLVPKQREDLNQLVNQQNQITTRLSDIEKQINGRQSRLNSEQKNLDKLPVSRDLSKLIDCLRLADERGDPERELQEKELHLAELQQRARVGLSRLSGWQGTLETLATTPFPRPETIQLFQKDFQDLDNEKKGLQSEIQKTHKHMDECENEIHALQRSVSVPTEQDLEAARKKRDQGWVLVREAWLDKKDITESERDYDPERSLPEAFEHQIQNADNIADRLRREAEQVARLAALTASIEQARNLLQEHERELALIEDRLAQKENEWRAIWQETGVLPRSPLEMLGWVQEIPGLSVIYNETQTDERIIGRLNSEISDLKERLRKELLDLQAGDPGSTITLRELRASAKRLIDSNEKLDHQRAEITAQIARTNEEIRNNQKDYEENHLELKRVSEEWTEAIQVFGQGIQVTPKNLTTILEQYDSVRSSMKEYTAQTQRIDRMAETLNGFTQETERLVTQKAPDLEGVQPDLAVERLADRLKKLIEEVKARQTLENDLRENLKNMERSRGSLEEVERTLQKLVQEASVSQADELPAAEERWATWQDLTTQVENLDAQLRDLSTNGKVESLLEEIHGIDPDQLAGEMKVSRDRIQDLARKNMEVSEQIGQVQKELERFGGSGEIAERATTNELVLADIAKLVRSYQRNRLALDLLQSQIRRFLNEYQTPMLSKASTFFSDLTQNAYESLLMDVDEKQNPILQVVSNEKKHLVLEQLSSGTLDQLYLALRLGNLTLTSSLDQDTSPSHLGRNEHYPLILDDVLINFDNERAKAAFQVFANLSKSIQVIYFTHHSHLIDLAREVLPKDEVHVQDMHPAP